MKAIQAYALMFYKMFIYIYIIQSFTKVVFYPVLKYLFKGLTRITICSISQYVFTQNIVF